MTRRLMIGAGLAVGLGLAAAVTAHGGRDGGAEGFDAPPRGGAGQDRARDEAGPREAQGRGGFGGERDRPMPRRPPPIEVILRHHADELGLDEAALEEIEAVADGERETLRDLRAAVHDARRAMHELLRSGAPPTDEAIRSAAAAIGRAEEQAAAHEGLVARSVLQLLTPEQRESLSTLGPPRPPRGGREPMGDRPPRDRGDERP